MAPSLSRAALLFLGASCGLGSVEIGGKTFSHTWNTKLNMLEKRSDMTASTVGDQIILIGGCVQDQTWSTMPWGETTYACGGGAAAAISAKTTAYMPLTNTHKALADAPIARYRHAAAAVGDVIYLFGGQDSTGGCPVQIDAFNVTAGTWSTLPFNWTAATSDNTAFSYNGKIYLVGGYDTKKDWADVKTTTIFDPTKSDAASAFSSGPELKQGRGDTAAVITGSTAIIVGGFHAGNGWAAPLKEIEQLDLPSGNWLVREAMEVGRGDKAVAALHGVVHVVGGETKNKDKHTVALADVEVYDPVGNKWYKGGNIPSKRFRFTAAVHKDSIYLFGGQGYLSGTYATTGSKYPVLDTVEEYKETVETKSEEASEARTPAMGLFAVLAAVTAVAF